ncbi:hypothetical protein SCP_0412860 [Sparassis crispa]|uniref:Uncharacterized protein n=1 Tax=Sparassis crispa TaxID=139825 RepID=A0A401GL78_9APHY|nr:hypothetical protein SCP_0412860 [Sparassis crispa]GBE82899.1 hypothetical protein SCP_0412860 [Sparassis crispa]
MPRGEETNKFSVLNCTQDCLQHSEHIGTTDSDDGRVVPPLHADYSAPVPLVRRAAGRTATTYIQWELVVDNRSGPASPPS